MLPCLPLFLGIRVQEPLLVGFINLELSGFLACLGKRRIIEFLLHKQIGILRLQEIDGGLFFQRQLVKRFLRCLVDDDVTLMRIVHRQLRQRQRCPCSAGRCGFPNVVLASFVRTGS